MNKKTIRLNESQLRAVIKESVKKVLREAIPTSWKEHDNGIATYDKNGDEITGYDFDGVGYHDESKEGMNRREESWDAYNFGHPYGEVQDEFEYTDFDDLKDPNRYYHFSHDDNNSRWERPHKQASLYNGMNEPKPAKRDKGFEKALNAADSRQLHRKGSLNREI